MKYSYFIPVLLLFAFACNNVQASEPDVTQILQVNTTDGNVYSFVLSDNLVVSPDYDKLIISDESGDLSFPITKLQCFIYTESSLSGLSAPYSQDILFNVKKNEIFLRFANPGDPLIFMHFDGKIIFSDIISEDGCYTLGTDNLEKGIYILSVGNRTLKFVKQ